MNIESATGPPGAEVGESSGLVSEAGPLALSSVTWRDKATRDDRHSPHSGERDDGLLGMNRALTVAPLGTSDDFL